MFSGNLIMKEKTIKSRTVFKGRLLKIDVLDVEVEPGRRSIREIVRHPGAAVVLARRPDGMFIFVRQFRKPAEKIILEVVAGGLEKAESPVACARRDVAVRATAEGTEAGQDAQIGRAHV